MRALLAALPLLLACGAPVGAALEDAREASRVPDGFLLHYEEVGGSLGERSFRLDAEGALVRRYERPGIGARTDAPSAEPGSDSDPGASGAIVTEATLDAREMQRVLETLVAIEAWEQADDGDLPAGPLEARRAWLELRAEGERARVWEWAHDLEANDRLVRIRRVLDELLAAHAVD